MGCSGGVGIDSLGIEFEGCNVFTTFFILIELLFHLSCIIIEWRLATLPWTLPLRRQTILQSKALCRPYSSQN